MRVVLDTNIFVSAALKDKSLPAIAVHLASGRGVVLKSVATEHQLFEVLARAHLASLVASTMLSWFTKILAAAELVAITERILACRDPTDDKFRELAVNGRADIIVTGDADLLVLNPFRNISVVTLAAFVQGMP